MSLRSESDENDGRSVLDLFEDWYHVPLLALIVGVMLRIRLLSYNNFVRANEVLFSGNDAWFHLRETTYVVKHWPFTMPFDIWTGFPVGKATGGQFGSLYDQLIATVALLLGFGSPSQALISKTLLVAPAVFGALAAIPVYFLGKRFGNRLSGLFGAVVLMLLPGTFLSRTLVGVADHNAIEPFFQALAVLGLVVAVSVAEREKPIWELVEAREWDALRPSLKWSALGGVAAALYMWVWPPGVLIVGAFAVFLVLKLSSDVYNEQSPEPVAFAAVVSMGVTALLVLVQVDTFRFATTDFSLLQPFFAILVGLGAIFMAYLAREWEARDIPVAYYPWTILGLLVLSLLVMSVVLPGLFGTIKGNFYRILAFSATASTRTIGEAQPFLQIYGLPPISTIMYQYGFTFFTGLVAAIWMLGKPILEDGDQRDYGFVFGSLAIIAIIFLFPGVHTAIANAIGMAGQVFALFVVVAIIAAAAHLAEHDAKNLLVISWAVFITCAAFTQVRFNYYLAIVVAVMNAYLFAEVISALDLRTSLDDFTENVEAYQIIAVVMVVLIVLMPVLVVPVGLSGAKTSTAWQNADRNSPGGITQWEGSLHWMSNNTPEEGNYANAGNADQLDYYGTYPRQKDFDYPKGAYGVMSWWDYGHWITLKGHRIPVANPFQQHATFAANYLLAPDETQAQNVLDQHNDANEPTRYVMVDWQMASTQSKFGAPTVFYNAENVSRSDFYNPMYQIQNGRIRPLSFNVRHQRYYDSQMIRLYMYHGSAMDPQRVVTDWEMTRVQTNDGGTTYIRTAPKDGNVIKQFKSVKQAQAYVQNDTKFRGEPTSQLGGVGRYPTERVEALKHYRLVHASEQTRQFTLLRTQYSAVKTFEKVPGATIHGTNAPANTTVTASVRMKMGTRNKTFVYTQQAQTNEQGEFTLVLPYSTTDYDEYGTEKGYTNVSVRAATPYTLSTPASVDNKTITQYGANVSVSEGRVVGAVDGAKQVQLEKKTQNFSLQRGSSPSGNQSASGAIDYTTERTGSSPAQNTDSHAAIDLPTTTEATDRTEATP